MLRDPAPPACRRRRRRRRRSARRESRRPSWSAAATATATRSDAAADRQRGAHPPPRRAGGRPRRACPRASRRWCALLARSGSGSAADGGVRARPDRRHERARPLVAALDRSVAAREGQRRRSARPHRRSRRGRSRSRAWRRRSSRSGALAEPPDRRDRRAARHPGRGVPPRDLRARPAEGVRRARVGDARAAGQPRVRWWPVAFALQRLEDPRALPALLTLVQEPHPYTRAFAAKGPRGD